MDAYIRVLLVSALVGGGQLHALTGFPWNKAGIDYAFAPEQAWTIWRNEQI
jgi:hypothetical protein